MHPAPLITPPPHASKSPAPRGARRRSRGVILRLLIVAVLAVTIAHVISALVLAQSGLRFTTMETERRIDTLLDSRAKLLAGPLWKLQYEELDNILVELTSDPAIRSAALYDDSGSMVRFRATRTPRTDPGTREYSVTKPLIYQNGNIRADAGRLVITMTDAPLYAVYQARINEALIIAAIAATVIVLAIWLASARLIGYPLALLTTAIRSSGEGGQRRRVDWENGSEFGVVIRAFNDMQDATERSERQLLDANRKLAYLVNHDELTGLANRRSVQEHLRLVEADPALARTLTVIFIDIDDFKNINDTLGHTIGDMLLQHIARQLQKQVGDAGIVARLGGDEFIILYHQTIPGPDLINTEHVLNSVRVPFTIAGTTLICNASIGVARLIDLNCSGQEALAMADIALYAAKGQGRGRAVVLTRAMRDEYFRRRDIELSLERAIDNDEFELFFQPQVNTRDDTVFGVEALVRWRHPTRGLLSPADFLQVIEDLGLSIRLGQWVIRTACQATRRMQDEFHLPIRMSINLSSAQIVDHSLVSGVLGEISRQGVGPELFELEITESSLIRHFATANDVVTALREAGIRIALDDFGTGYSSLAYLRRFPIDTIKLDRAFIAELPEYEATVAIIRAIRNLAEALDISVIAEGVERQAEVDILNAEKISVVQGYLYARPLSYDEVIAFIRRTDRRLREAPGKAIRLVAS